MSQKERDRLKVLHETNQRQITQKQAAQQMGISERWVRKLLARMRKEGDRAVLHRLRGRRSNRKIPDQEQQRAVEWVQREYRDFGPTLASEYLSERQGIRVSRETLRGWMTAARLWKPKRRRVERIHQWRPRRAQIGELVQWDTSEHDWLEGRGPQLYLIAIIDDATAGRWRGSCCTIPRKPTWGCWNYGCGGMAGCWPATPTRRRCFKQR